MSPRIPQLKPIPRLESVQRKGPLEDDLGEFSDEHADEIDLTLIDWLPNRRRAKQ